MVRILAVLVFLLGEVQSGGAKQADISTQQYFKGLLWTTKQVQNCPSSRVGLKSGVIPAHASRGSFMTMSNITYGTQVSLFFYSLASLSSVDVFLFFF